jgi:hypothetical protein
VRQGILIFGMGTGPAEYWEVTPICRWPTMWVWGLSSNPDESLYVSRYVSLGWYKMHGPGLLSNADE